MKATLTLSLFSIAMPLSHAASIAFAGVINDNNGSEITDWRTPSTPASLDGDGDNIYGSTAFLFYRVVFDGQNTVYTFDGSDAQVGPFPGYTFVDHPDGVSPDIQLRTTTNGAGGQSNHVMFTFTALVGSPQNVRVGVVTDGLDGPQFSPTSIGLAQVAGGSVEHTLTSVNNVPDMVFFDLFNVQAGDQLQVFGDSGSGGFATHQIVTWDALPVPEPSSLGLLIVGAGFILRRRSR